MTTPVAVAAPFNGPVNTKIKFAARTNGTLRPCLRSIRMTAELHGDLRLTFVGLLNLALTRGRATLPGCGLGPATAAAIDLVAYDHPDAEPESIAAAYDAFDREHAEFG
jgi:hypothetical protein